MSGRSSMVVFLKTNEIWTPAEEDKHFWFYFVKSNLLIILPKGICTFGHIPPYQVNMWVGQMSFIRNIARYFICGVFFCYLALIEPLIKGRWVNFLSSRKKKRTEFWTFVCSTHMWNAIFHTPVLTNQRTSRSVRKKQKNSLAKKKNRNWR